MKNWAERFLKESNSMNAFAATFRESDGVKYILFDLDDTVRESVSQDNGEQGPPLRVEQVHVFHGVGSAIKKWMDAGWVVVGATNQKGALRRRSFIPQEHRQGATLEQAAEECGKVIGETLTQLGVSFPVMFASDGTVFIYSGGKVSVGGLFGSETQQTGKAFKPHPSMGLVAFKMFGQPVVEESYMIGDSYENGDEMFAKSLGFKWIHPGPLGRDFIEFTNEKFSIDEQDSFQQPATFYNTH